MRRTIVVGELCRAARVVRYMRGMHNLSSADGRFTLEISAWEARMSHWIETPRLVDTATGALMFAFADGNWSLDRATWPSAHVVQLVLRKYPGSHTPADVTCEIDCVSRSARIAGEEVPLGELERKLDAALHWR